MSVFVCLLISLGLYVPGAVCVCVACGHDSTTHKTTGGHPMTDQVPGWARDTYDRDCLRGKHYGGEYYICEKAKGHGGVCQEGDVRWIGGMMVAPLPALKGGADRG